MSDFYKICIEGPNDSDANEHFLIQLIPQFDALVDLKKKIIIRKPEFENQPYKLYYKDNYGDYITIFDQVDFDHFLTQLNHRLFVKVAPTETATNSMAPMLKHEQSHVNVTCDVCDKGIYGNRFKCLECRDFDLCAECEQKSHGHHLMIRIADPKDTICRHQYFQ